MNVFDTTDFITRDCCGTWGMWQYWAQFFDLLLFAAYFVIPYWFWRQTKNSPMWRRWPVIPLIAFFLGCGLGHLADFAAFWWAPYRLYTLIDGFTAISSVVFAVGASVFVHLILGGGADE